MDPDNDPKDHTQNTVPDSQEPSGNTAQSFGQEPQSLEPDLRAGRSSPVALSSDRRLGLFFNPVTDPLFTQLSLGTGHGTPQRRRGDIHPSTALERYLNSETRNPSSQLNAPPEKGEQTDPAQIAKLIWGTTVNIEDSLGMFRDFILNYRDTDAFEQGPFYQPVLQKVL